MSATSPALRYFCREQEKQEKRVRVYNIPMYREKNHIATISQFLIHSTYKMCWSLKLREKNFRGFPELDFSYFNKELLIFFFLISC